MFFQSKNAMHKVRNRVIAFIDEQDKKDKALAEIRKLTKPIVERAISIKHKYIEDSIPEREQIFYVTRLEMDYLQAEYKTLFGKETPPDMVLGMKYEIGDFIRQSSSLSCSRHSSSSSLLLRLWRLFMKGK